MQCNLLGSEGLEEGSFVGVDVPRSSCRDGFGKVKPIGDKENRGIG